MEITLKTKLKNEKGQGLIEYALLVAFIAIAGLAATKAMTSKTCARFNQVGNALVRTGPQAQNPNDPCQTGNGAAQQSGQGPFIPETPGMPDA
jgi:Flp pilus assembly pilin Flp